MNGMYNGATMKLRYLFPKQFKTQVVNLSAREEQRLSWIDWYVGHKRNARLTCRHFGIAPSVFYRWLVRFEDGNKQLSTLKEKSYRPKRVRTPTTDDKIVNMVTFLRRENPAWSKYKIESILLRDFGVKTSASNIGRILSRKGLVNPNQYGYRRKYTQRINHKIPRIRALKGSKDAYPGSLIQVDTKRLNVLGVSYYQFTAVDCCTRIQYIDVYSTISSNSGRQFLSGLLKYFPFKIDIQSDNGSEFLKEFHHLCEETNTPHFFIYPRCPKQNGRVERLNQTCTYEFWDYQDDLLPELFCLKEKAQVWNRKYNTYRPHQALGYLTPKEYYEHWLESTPEDKRPKVFC